jgi:hypothetical protein
MTPRSIHAKCCATRDEDGRPLICGKSRGHKRAEHYDPDADAYWASAARINPTTKETP